MNTEQKLFLLGAIALAGAYWIMNRPQRFAGDATNANLQAFLATLRASEGTDQYPDPWGTYYGGGQFTDKSDHPVNTGAELTGGNGASTIAVPVSGPNGTTTAAGAYQIELTTWMGLGGKGHYGDFSDASQDAAAMDLITGRGAMDDVIAGNFADAIGKLGNEWASLPGSPYGQPTVSMDDLLNVYQQAGGQIASG